MSECEPEVIGRVTEGEALLYTGELVVEEDHRRPPWATLLTWLVVILVVLTVVSVARSYIVQDAAESAEAAAKTVGSTADQARDAAIEARDELRAAVKALEESRDPNEPDLQNQAIIDALEAIARIEVYLCGGPCPEQ